ncbi:MAG: hypothetical protein QOG46_2198 [Pseudonocardiales bacterium]|nr:hypothetical protein [Pseudonocardiales bacterium]
MTHGWHALHAFLAAGLEETDAYLTETVGPAANDAVRSREASAWFFIRYWEDGHHVRLRLRDVTPERAATVEAALAAGLLERAAPEASSRSGVHAVPYEPELERYGGPDGVAISEELFAVSSQVALAVVARTPERPARLATALTMLLVFVDELGLPPLEAVRWLRTNVAIWPLAREAGGIDLPAVRDRAERDFLARERVLLRQAQRVREHEGEGSVFSAWGDAVARTLARYREIESEGRLAAPGLQLMRSQLHMFHNRLGLTIGDECHLQWLASMILAAAGPRVDFFAEGPAAPDRAYHAQSKFLKPVFAGQRPNSSPAAERSLAERPRPRVPAIALPRFEPSTVTLGEALRRRRSGYGAYEGPVGLDELGALLGMAAGQVEDAGRPYPLRAYPSSGASHPLRLIVLPFEVDGLESRLHVYDDAAHALQPLPYEPAREVLLRASPFLDPADSPNLDAREAPVFLFCVADLAYHRDRYGLRSYRFVALECGHLAQNLCLVATALGLATVTIGGFYDDAVNHLLGVDGVNQATLYVLPLGRLRPASEPFSR